MGDERVVHVLEDEGRGVEDVEGDSIRAEEMRRCQSLNDLSLEKKGVGEIGGKVLQLQLIELGFLRHDLVHVRC
jgi:hypothetical protein